MTDVDSPGPVDTTIRARAAALDRQLVPEAAVTCATAAVLRHRVELALRARPDDVPLEEWVTALEPYFETLLQRAFGDMWGRLVLATIEPILQAGCPLPPTLAPYVLVNVTYGRLAPWLEGGSDATHRAVAAALIGLTGWLKSQHYSIPEGNGVIAAETLLKLGPAETLPVALQALAAAGDRQWGERASERLEEELFPLLGRARMLGIEPGKFLPLLMARNGSVRAAAARAVALPVGRRASETLAARGDAPGQCAAEHGDLPAVSPRRVP